MTMKGPSKFKIQFKKDVIFHLILVGIPFSLILFVKNRGREFSWGFYFNIDKIKFIKHGKNSLLMLIVP